MRIDWRKSDTGQLRDDRGHLVNRGIEDHHVGDAQLLADGYQLVDDLRTDGYCPVTLREGKVSSSGEAAKVCESLAGGNAGEDE